MRDSRFRVEAFSRSYDRSAFSCGNKELDSYLQTQASQDQRRNVSRVYLLIDGRDERIAGYYTLSASSILLPQLPEEWSSRLPSYPQCPAILLGRLAVDQSFHGQGAGGALLMNALERSLAIAEELAAFAIVVDAIDENARAFYEHHEFIQLTDKPQRLFLPLRTIQSLLNPDR